MKANSQKQRCLALRYDAFCWRIFDYACLRLIAIEEARNYGKVVGLYIKGIFENGWWEDAYMHTPHPVLLDRPWP